MPALKRLSHSAITDLLDACAYRVGLDKIVGLDRPTNGRLAVGTAYHAGIEAHEKQRRLYRLTSGRQGNPDGVTQKEMFREAMDVIADQGVDWNADEMSYYKAGEMVQDSLDHWFNTPLPEGQPGAGGSLRDRVMEWQPIGVEGWFTIWMPPHTSLPVVGAIDTVYLVLDREIVVVDHKSANSFGKWRLDGVGIKDQAALYVAAARLSPGIPVPRDTVPRFEYHIARTSSGKKANFQGARCISVDVDHVDLEYIEQRISLAHQQQLAGRWIKNPDTWLCNPKWCPFHQDAGGPCDPHGPAEYDIEAFV